MSDSDPWIGRRLGHFHVLSRLGAGGMGVVYRAQDEALRREVAIKLLPNDALHDPERRSRFLREARAAAAVTHPCIATVHAVEESADGVVYLVMELVEGESLRARLVAVERLDEAEAIRVGIEIARGVARAHARGIVHRDLKPENVMLEPDGAVKVLDFGLAKLRTLDDPATPETETRSLDTAGGALLGTPAYIAPEQARGEKVDARTDVFAMGVMLYEMIAGERPFRGPTAADVIAAILKEPAPALASSLPALASLVASCLEKRPDDRPADGAALVERLRALAGAQTTPTATPVDPMAAMLGVTKPDERAAAPQPTPRTNDSPSRGHRSAVPWVVAVLAVAAVVSAIAWRSRDEPAASASSRHPQGAVAAATAAASHHPAIPPLPTVMLDATGAITVDVVAMFPGGDRVVLGAMRTVEIRSLRGPERQRLLLPEGTTTRGVDVASDSRSVLVAVERPDATHALLRWIPGSEPTVVRENVTNAALSPDGSRIASVQDDALVLTQLPGGGQRTLLRSVFRDSTPSWSPDGRALSVIVLDPVMRLVHVTLDGRVTVLVDTRLGGASVRAAFVDARTVLTVVAEPDALGSLVCLVDVGAPEAKRCFGRLPFLEGGWIGVDRVGRHAAIVTRSALAQLRLYPVTGDALAEPRALDTDVGNLRVYHWIDAATLLVGANRRGRWEVLAWPIDGSAPRVLATAPDGDYTYPAPAPDGDGLYAFWLPDTPDENDEVPWSVVRVRDGRRVATVRDAGDRTQRSRMGRPMPAAAIMTAPGVGLLTIPGRPESRVVELPSGRVAATLAGTIGPGPTLAGDGRTALVPLDDRLVELDLARGLVTRTVFTRRGGVVLYADEREGAVTFSFDGEAGAEPQRIVRVDRAGRTVVLRQSGTEWFGNLALSPDGRSLVVVVRPTTGDRTLTFDVPGR